MKRLLQLIFRLPFLPLSLLFFVFSTISLAWWRWRRLSPGRIYVLDWSGEILEHKDEGRLQRMLRDFVSGRSDDDIDLSNVRAIRRSIARRAPAGLLVRLGPLEAGYPKCEALRTELEQIARHTKVQVFLRAGATSRELLVAGAAHSVSAPPSVHVDCSGAAATGFFGVRLLERIGLKANLASRGRYKSAVEPFTRSDRSEADREQTTALLEGIDRKVMERLSVDRKKSQAEILAIMDEAPYGGEQAQAIGLIDLAVREDELIKQLGKELDPVRLRLERGGQLVRGDRIPRLRLLPSGKRKVGIVMAAGTIVDRRAPHRVTQAAEPEVIDDLRSALADDQIGAVVLLVDSPGGSATASDAIFGAVKRLDQEKPVIACFSDVAASGGYYIACGARKIVAAPETITGSIGVFHLMPNASGLLEKLEINVDTLKLRKNADLGSPWRLLEPEEQAKLDRDVSEIYDRFTSLVAAARNLNAEQVEAVAQGRVWLGADAHRRGLIDELGGLETALKLARELGQGPFEDEPIVVRTKRRTQNRLPPSPRIDPVSSMLELIGPTNRAERALLEQLFVLRTTSHQAAWLYAPLRIR